MRTAFCIVKPNDRGKLAVADGSEVQVEDGFFLVALHFIFLAQGNDLAQDLDIKALALGFVIDFLDVAHDAGLVFLKALDALDDGAQAGLGGAGNNVVGGEGEGGVVGHGGYPVKAVRLTIAVANQLLNGWLEDKSPSSVD
jgi:hypothetical protein